MHSLHLSSALQICYQDDRETFLKGPLFINLDGHAQNKLNSENEKKYKILSLTPHFKVSISVVVTVSVYFK
jgi:hypothetical protein